MTFFLEARRRGPVEVMQAEFRRAQETGAEGSAGDLNFLSSFVF